MRRRTERKSMDNNYYSNISVLIDEKTLNKRIQELGETISRDYAGHELKLICILKGSVLFMSELAKRITVPVLFDFMQVSSYGSGTSSSGSVKIRKDLDEDIAGQDVLIVEDIIDSGNTLHKLTPILRGRNPKSLKVVSLLDKPERREVPFEADYRGFEIPDEFVVGFGLDYDQKYRNLPYIGVLHL